MGMRLDQRPVRLRFNTPVPAPTSPVARLRSLHASDLPPAWVPRPHRHRPGPTCQSEEVVAELHRTLIETSEQYAQTLHAAVRQRLLTQFDSWAPTVGRILAAEAAGPLLRCVIDSLAATHTTRPIPDAAALLELVDSLVDHDRLRRLVGAEAGPLLPAAVAAVFERLTRGAPIVFLHCERMLFITPSGDGVDVSSTRPTAVLAERNAGSALSEPAAWLVPLAPSSVLVAASRVELRPDVGGLCYVPASSSRPVRVSPVAVVMGPSRLEPSAGASAVCTRVSSSLSVFHQPHSLADLRNYRSGAVGATGCSS